MRIIIDRFEEGYAVCETEKGEFVNIPVHIIPPDAGEGGVIDIIYRKDITLERRKRIEQKMDILFKKNDK